MMEWVETTARTVEEAKELALDQLGVAADEADFEVLAEPKQGLFGRVRGEARVRARVRPAPVRPKQDRRRGRRPAGESNGETTEQPSKHVAPAGNGDGDADRGRRRGGRSTTPRTPPPDRPETSGGSEMT